MLRWHFQSKIGDMKATVLSWSRGQYSEGREASATREAAREPALKLASSRSSLDNKQVVPESD
jgi:hypothetical protein